METLTEKEKALQKKTKIMEKLKKLINDEPDKERRMKMREILNALISQYNNEVLGITD